MNLHAIPELDRTLPKTIAYVLRQLSSLSCGVFQPVPGGICAFFDFGKSETLAFRADMDGLPITEETGLSYASRHPGCMHACGHDGHTAILLELAQKIHEAQSFPYNALLIFQPAEETDGGARDICETGILEQYGVKAIFGLHVWPGLPKGQIFSRPGVLMATACGVHVQFFGKSVHVAQAHQGADALTACCEFHHRVTDIQKAEPYLLKFGKVTGGTAPNIVCGQSELSGSLRAWDVDVLEGLKTQICKICHQTAEETGCTGQVSFTQGYPAVFNDPDVWKRVCTLTQVWELNEPVMTTEDFSFYQKRVPGVFFLLGIGDTAPLHSPRFSLDPNLLPLGTALFLCLLQNLL